MERLCSWCPACGFRNIKNPCVTLSLNCRSPSPNDGSQTHRRCSPRGGPAVREDLAWGGRVCRQPSLQANPPRQLPETPGTGDHRLQGAGQIWPPLGPGLDATLCGHPGVASAL